MCFELASGIFLIQTLQTTYVPSYKEIRLESHRKYSDRQFDASQFLKLYHRVVSCALNVDVSWNSFCRFSK
jgi:hypothetical protein